MTPWTVARQAPLSVGCSRQGYWSGLPCPPPGDLPNPGTEPGSPALQAELLPLSHWGGMVLPFVVFTGRGSNGDGCGGGRERGQQMWVQEGGLRPRRQTQTQVWHASSRRVCQPQTVP